MREFQNHSTFLQTSTQEKLQQMAIKLKERQNFRSGLFLYSDLSQHDSEERSDERNNLPSPASNSQDSRQPEEEPVRRPPPNLPRAAEQLAEATNTPVPESPMSAAPDETAEEENLQSESAAPSTASFDSDQESS